jgi:hypothetical protein
MANPSEDKVREQMKNELKQHEDMRKDAQTVETVGDLLNYSIKNKERSLAVLIEFLWQEQKVVTLEDKLAVLDKFMLEKHRPRMNGLIMKFIDSGKSIYNDLI